MALGTDLECRMRHQLRCEVDGSRAVRRALKSLRQAAARAASGALGRRPLGGGCRFRRQAGGQHQFQRRPRHHQRRRRRKVRQLHAHLRRSTKTNRNFVQF